MKRTFVGIALVVAVLLVATAYAEIYLFNRSFLTERVSYWWGLLLIFGLVNIAVVAALRASEKVFWLIFAQLALVALAPSSQDLLLAHNCRVSETPAACEERKASDARFKQADEAVKLRQGIFYSHRDEAPVAMEVLAVDNSRGVAKGVGEINKTTHMFDIPEACGSSVHVGQTVQIVAQFIEHNRLGGGTHFNKVMVCSEQ